jgi:hypothetical protein
MENRWVFQDQNILLISFHIKTIKISRYFTSLIATLRDPLELPIKNLRIPLLLIVFFSGDSIGAEILLRSTLCSCVFDFFPLAKKKILHSCRLSCVRRRIQFSVVRYSRWMFYKPRNSRKRLDPQQVFTKSLAAECASLLNVFPTCFSFCAGNLIKYQSCCFDYVLVEQIQKYNRDDRIGFPYVKWSVN